MSTLHTFKLYLPTNFKQLRKMKKIILSFMLVLMAQMSFGQTATDFVNSYKSNPACQHMLLSKELIPMMAAQAPEETKAMLKKVESMDMMMFQSCPADLKENLKKDLTKLTNNGYVKNDVEDKGTSATILIKMDKEIIKEMVVMADNNDMVVVSVIKGSFTKEDMASAGSMLH